MEASNRHSPLRLPILILAFFLVTVGSATVQPGSSAEDGEAPPRVSAVCLDCHDGHDATLSRTPHKLSSKALDGLEAKVTCTDCHAGDPRHYEEDPETYPMGNPDSLSADAAAFVCSTCHQNSHQQNMEEKNVHLVNDVSCMSCHQIHGSSDAGLLQDAQFDLCVSCHAGVEGAFAQPYRHPVSDGIIQCSECHQTLDETARELSLNGTNVCMECHTEFQGPFPYEHQATVDYSTHEGGCLNCHEHHGSALPRMIRQPYEPPHYQLCTQCHAVPGHNQNSFHGTQWSGMPCNDCHVDIHGSYSSRYYFSDELEGQGCFNSGCHRF